MKAEEIKRLATKIKHRAAHYGANCRVDGESGSNEAGVATREAFTALCIEIDILAGLVRASESRSPEAVLTFAAKAWRTAMHDYDRQVTVKLLQRGAPAPQEEGTL